MSITPLKNLIFIPVIIFLAINTLFAQQNRKTYTVYFDFGKSTLRPQTKKMLDEVAKEAKSHHIIIESISGFTDNVGGNAYNYTLGYNRASAVNTYLSQTKDKDAKEPSLASKGRLAPINGNKTEAERQANRKVDIVCLIRHKKADTTLLTKKTDTLNFSPPCGTKLVNCPCHDTIITFPKGTRLILRCSAFDTSVHFKDIEWNMKEVFTVNDMLENNVLTQTSDGTCLRTGGMIFMNPTIRGKKLEPLPDSSITVQIPTKAVDTAMRLYTSNPDKNGTVWNKSDTKIRSGGRGKYYQFPAVNLSIGYNCDVPLANQIVSVALAPVILPVALTVVGVTALVNLGHEAIERLKKPSYTFVSRRYKYQKIMVVDTIQNVVLKGKIRKPRQANITVCGGINDLTVLSVSERKGKMYLAKVPVSKLKFRRFWNFYVIKKKDYKLVTEAELTRIFGKFSKPETALNGQ